MSLRTKASRLSTRRTVTVAAGAVVTAIVVIVGSVMIEHRQVEVSDSRTVAATSTIAPAAGSGPAGAVVALDPAPMPDGGVPARVGDTALATVENGRSASPLRVSGGRLRHGEPVDTDASSMVVAALPAPVTRIGATVEFPAYGGSVAMEAWQAPPTADAKPAAGVHVVVSPQRWEMSVWDAAAGRIVLAGGDRPPVAPDAPQTFEVTRTGDTAVLTMPDGQQHSVSDPRISEWAGRYAAWELYEYQPGIRPASISAMWAS